MTIKTSIVIRAFYHTKKFANSFDKPSNRSLFVVEFLVSTLVLYCTNVSKKVTKNNYIVKVYMNVFLKLLFFQFP